MNYEKLSKEVSYALRHAPWEYELELDEEGWVDIDQLLSSLHNNNLWKTVNAHHLAQMIEQSEKKRHEIQGNRIRAKYGHSIPQRIVRIATTPPEALYHGTARNLVNTILTEGLQPMSRQYVHMSVDTHTANLVGKRKDNAPILLMIDAKRASEEGVLFYKGNDAVWLADHIPSQYIHIS